MSKSFEYRDHLNPKLFDNEDNLKENIREAILRITTAFTKDLQENNIPIRVLDIWLVGSNASYNYTDTSDIDVHIIADMDISDCSNMLRIVYDYAKASFNKSHEIKIKGLPVELYIEGLNSTSITNGIYSIQHDQWLKFPKLIEEQPFSDEEVDEIYVEMKNEIEDCLQSEDLERVQSVLNKLYITRQISLATEGEYGKGNLAFKKARNEGLLDKLKDKKIELIDKDLTLEQLKEAQKKKNPQIEITPGDPAAGMNFFNSAMGASSPCTEELKDPDSLEESFGDLNRVEAKRFWESLIK